MKVRRDLKTVQCGGFPARARLYRLPSATVERYCGDEVYGCVAERDWGSKPQGKINGCKKKSEKAAYL